MSANTTLALDDSCTMRFSIRIAAPRSSGGERSVSYLRTDGQWGLMDRVFSTDAAHPRDRFDYWHDVACKKIIGHEATPADRLKFEAAIESASLSTVDLIMFRNAPMRVTVTPENIAQARDDRVFVCRQMEGTVRFEQDGRQAVLKAGEFTVLDPRRPYGADFESQSRMLLLMVPRCALEQRFGRIDQFSTHVMRGDNALNALAADHLALLPRHASSLEGSAASMVVSYTLDLVALALLRIAGETRSSRTTNRSLAVSNLRAMVEARLGDPTFNAASLVASAGMSLRYAQSLLAEQGTSPSSLIQQRRLERCKDALANATQNQQTIAEIAFGWGFADLTNFGRLFKKRFGATPRQYRCEQSSR